ncbi:MAG TPA: hypothetical protein VMH36_22835 [Alphaproteobacteria bacterium]|nr:hypothetical protein [Alphaproteobacteria bacterium]
MGSFSVWHWIVLFVIVALLALPFVATATENTGKVVSRHRFVVWFLSTFLGIPILSSATAAVMPMAALLWWPIGIVVVYLYQRTVVRRCRDAGHTKALAYFGAIPLLNVAVGIYLLFKSSASPVAPAPVLA